ncbi:MAG: polyprenyl synthetase family protein [Planctomycetaceae bacterium]|nr:polyprenyl synthetase family protein [Planctomycetaceae bacterium]
MSTIPRNVSLSQPDEQIDPRDDQEPSSDERPRKRKRRSTSHLKQVPPTLEQREHIKAAAERYVRDLGKDRPFSKSELEAMGRELLASLGLEECYLGFTMVLLGNFFWKRQMVAIPFERRMLLLPHCLKHAEGCPADYNEFGLDCETCGACSIADYKVKAEQLGYKVLVAEGSPIVLKIIVEGYVDGIVGVACLNVLEKAIDKVLLAGVPSYAIPLHSGDCKNTSLDEAWVWDVLEVYEPLPDQRTAGYIPLMREGKRLFDKEEFDRLLPPLRIGQTQTPRSPLAKTEEIARDWLANGGKRFRPFITLAAWDARLGGEATRLDPSNPAPLDIPDAVKKSAIAIEAFHKASLVHDDIQDDDQYRYGEETLHRRHGVGMAINVGDYLIGMGYRLLAECHVDGDPLAVSDIVQRMSLAHIKLCEGQGAEMEWTNHPSLDLTPLDAMQIYALKTSPAFEAALYAGLRLSGDIAPYEEMIPAFCRHLGVGFQILNDLKDWRGDVRNKVITGQDAMALRPTLLLAMAIKAASPEQRTILENVLKGDPDSPLQRLELLKLIFEQTDAFNQAEMLVEKSRERAEALADAVQPESLRHYLYFLIDTVLAPEEGAAEPENGPVLVSLSFPEES